MHPSERDVHEPLGEPADDHVRPASDFSVVADVVANGDAAGSDLAEAARRLRALIMAGERYRVALADASGLGTTESQALGYLFVHGPRGQSDLARDLALTSSAATALVDRLERHGVAERGPHPSDRRRLLVRLTEQGQQIGIRSQEPLLESLRQIGPEELRTVTSWLGLLAASLHDSSSRSRG